MTSSKFNYVPRVTQTDATSFDQSIFLILADNVKEIINSLNSHIANRFQPEIHAVIRLLLWKFSVQKAHSTFGQQLLGITYGSDFSKNDALLMALLRIAPKYIDDRSSDVNYLCVKHQKFEWISEVLKYTKILIQCGEIINFIAFLIRGKYPTLVERILHQPLRHIHGSEQRQVGYKIMMQELIWHGFMDLLVFVLPLVNFSYIQRTMRKILFWKTSTVGKRQQISYTAETRCAICRNYPILPHHVGCSHVFCYYCIHANFLDDPRFECPGCGMKIEDKNKITAVDSSTVS